jgi:hypothetical protein
LFVAGAGYAILFLCFTAGQIITAFLVLSYTAHIFLTVTVDTAAGSDEIAFPSEPLVDWLWKGFYLAWLAAFWLVPACLLWILARSTSRAPLVGWHAVALVGGLLWLAFPVSLLSSLSAGSRLVVLRAAIIKGLICSPLTAALYYWMSALLWAAVSGLVYQAEFADRFWLIPVAAMAVAAAILVNARLLGRLAWLLSCRTPRTRKKTAAKVVRRSVRKSKVLDPWDAPQEEPTPDKSSVPRAAAARKKRKGVYELTDALPAPKKEEPFPMPEGYELAAEPEPRRPEPVPPQNAPQSLASQYQPQDEERELPVPPSLPMLQGVLTFPWYGGTLMRWVVMSLGFALMGVLLLGQIAYFPF